MANTKLSLKDLADGLADKQEITKAKSHDVLRAAFDSIATHVEQGGTIAIHGFGTFKPKLGKARDGRNPSTGETIHIEASQTLGFKPVPSLKKIT